MFWRSSFSGAAALQHGDLARAIDYNNRVLKSGLHRADALSNLSLAYYRQGRMDQALASAREALRTDSNHRAARANLVLILETMGSEKARSDDTEGALASFQEAATAEPENLDIRERVAAILHQAGRLDEARGVFESVLAAAPARPEPKLSLAILDLEEGHLQEAAVRLKQIPATWSGSYRVQFYLGEVYRTSGDATNARRAYTMCLAIAPPNDPIVLAARHALAGLR